MSTPDLNNFLNFVFAVSPWMILKVLVCFSFLLYIMFALVIVKQVNLMTQTLGGQLELPLKLIAAIHLAGAIFIFVLAIMIL